MNPEIWGKHMWTSIHFVALGYPNEPTQYHKNAYKTFFDSLAQTLPCKSCSDHFKQLLKSFPLTDDHLKNNMKLFEWTVFLHNKVNKKLNKPIIDTKTATKIYLELDTFNTSINNCEKKNKEYPIYVCISLLIVIFILLLIMFRNCIMKKKQ